MSVLVQVLTSDHLVFNGQGLKIVYSPEASPTLKPDFEVGQVLVRERGRRNIRELVRRYFLTESSGYVIRKTAQLAPMVGVRPRRVDVREIGKWGYCTRGGRLSFSWQLAALPERLRDYVVLHELSHLVEFNHSRAFRRILARHCPDFLEREKELELFVPYDRLEELG